MLEMLDKQDFENKNLRVITIDELKVGMYVKLDLPWIKHPFTKKQYKISNEKEIAAIRKYGIQKLVIDLEKSELSGPNKKKFGAPVRKKSPRKKQSTPKTSKSGPSKTTLDPSGNIERKIKKLETSKNAYSMTCKIVEDIFDDISSDKRGGLSKSRELVTAITCEVEKDTETFVHLINLHFRKDFIQFHSLNVCLLSLILGKTLRMPPEEMKILGMGALFHDIGKRTLPLQLVTKKTPYTRVENSAIMTHCQTGRDILMGQDGIPGHVPDIVFQHHEYLDGSGYPLGLQRKDIQNYSKIVCVANIYENLTNPYNLDNMMMPHQALSYMYRNMKEKLTQILVETLVKSLGVYPPGSVVELSDGNIGMVLSINRLATLRPTILVYDSKVLGKDPTILDLNGDRSIKITKALKMTDLSKEVIESLKLDKRKGYSTASDDDA